MVKLCINLLMCISVISKALAQADVSAQSLSTGYGLYVCIIIVPLLKNKQNKKQGAGEFQRCTVIKYHNQHWLRVIGVMPILFGTLFSRGLVHANPLLWMMIVFSYDVMIMQRCEFNFLSRILISIASSSFDEPKGN